MVPICSNHVCPICPVYIYNVCINCFEDIVLRWWVKHIERCCSVGWIWNTILPFVSPNGPQPILRNFNWKSNCTYVSHHGILVNSRVNGWEILVDLRLQGRPSWYSWDQPSLEGWHCMHGWVFPGVKEYTDIATLNDVQPLWGWTWWFRFSTIYYLISKKNSEAWGWSCFGLATCNR